MDSFKSLQHVGRACAGVAEEAFIPRNTARLWRTLKAPCHDSVEQTALVEEAAIDDTFLIFGEPFSKSLAVD